MSKSSNQLQRPVLLAIPLLCLSMLGCEKPPSNFGPKIEAITKRYYAAYENKETLDKGPASLTAVLRDLKILSKQHPQEWLPSYWCGFIHSVSADVLSQKDDTVYLAHLDSAQACFDAAWRFRDQLSGEDKSELYASQANMFQLKSWKYSEDQESYEKYRALAQEFVAKARDANPQNPKPHVSSIPDIYSDDEAVKNRAKKILEEGLKKYAAYAPANKHYPKWGESLIKTHFGEMFGQSQE